MSHTPEPWKVSGIEHVVAAGQYVVALDCKPDDARRIVACVNACAGIPTYQLTVEDGGAPLLLCDTIDALRKQRDDLLAALKKAEEAIREMAVECDGDYDLADELLAEINNAESKP